MSQDLKRAREIAAQTVTEIKRELAAADAVHIDPSSLTLPGRLELVAEFCAINREHLNADSYCSVSLTWEYEVRIHISGDGNAPGALAWTLDQLSDATFEVHKGDDVMQLYVSGTWRGLSVKIVSLARGEEQSRLAERIDWDATKPAKFDHIAVDTSVLRELAAGQVTA